MESGLYNGYPGDADAWANFAAAYKLFCNSATTPRRTPRVVIVVSGRILIAQRRRQIKIKVCNLVSVDDEKLGRH